MADFDGFDPGNTCWIDLGTSDVDGAIEFYGALFSWTANRQRPDYIEMLLNGKTVAGVMPLMQSDQPTAWSTYIAVDDAVVCAQRVKSAGGAVLVEPTQVDDVGSFAVFADTSGAVFCVWQSGTSKGVEVGNEVNAWGYSEVQTPDTSRAQQFYGDVFGWKAVSNAEYGMDGSSWFLGDKHLGGLMEPSTTVDGGKVTGWLNYFQVEDLDATIELAKSKGGSLVVQVTDSPIGTFATLADPQGAIFGVAQMRTS